MPSRLPSFRTGCWHWRCWAEHLGHPHRCTVGETKAQRVVTGSPESPSLAGWGRAIHLRRAHPFVGEPFFQPPPQKALITGLGGSLSPAGPFAPQSHCRVEMRIWWFAAGFQVCLRKPGILRRLVQPERPYCGCRLPLIGSILGLGSTPPQLEEGKGVFQYVLWVWGSRERQNRRLPHPQSAWLPMAGAQLFAGKDSNKQEA